MNDMERLISKVWIEVLGIPDVEIDDNFFEIGGDSLSALRVVSKLDFEINLTDIYSNPTIRLLADMLSNEKKASSLLINLTEKYDEQNINFSMFSVWLRNCAGIQRYKQLDRKEKRKI